MLYVPVPFRQRNHRANCCSTYEMTRPKNLYGKINQGGIKTVIKLAYFVSRSGKLLAKKNR